MGPLMWCPCIIGVGRRGGRVEGLEGVGVSMSESVYDGGIAGSAQRDSFLPVVGVGVGESVYDGGGAGSAQRDDVFSVLGVRTSESVYDGGGAGSAQRDLSIVGVGVLDGVTACVARGVRSAFRVIVVGVVVCGIVVELFDWASCSSANADLKNALSPDWFGDRGSGGFCCGGCGERSSRL